MLLSFLLLISIALIVASPFLLAVYIGYKSTVATKGKGTPPQSTPYSD